MGIRRILDDYAAASGQVVNFSKYVLCVSMSVSRAEGTHLAVVVGVNLGDCHERYLGLLSFASKINKQLFIDIKNRVLEKVKGWKNKLLRAGGKRPEWDRIVVEVLMTFPDSGQAGDFYKVNSDEAVDDTPNRIGLVPTIVESDAKSVVDLVNLGVISAADIGVIITDILSLISCNSIIVSFVSRKANVVVHSLIRLALYSIDDSFGWSLTLPGGVLSPG
ncbi:hypothetical protein Dsin_029253 [Dipteronia sinensis]|uniref:RNase H type-1 domain-containing protein n=1 Tax=Dipteronia sinensis TaxID=43782 RepID=A0AAD9ZSA8_9ROSI|nr:hypothetical protein Dsin_029253 [Dipteronia sinensis]